MFLSNSNWIKSLCIVRVWLIYRNIFDEEKIPQMTGDDYLQDIHSISSLLKMYFRELPNPLLTYQLYNKFIVSFFHSRQLFAR